MRLLSASLVLSSFVSVAATAAVSLPVTPKRPVVNEYHGVKVADDYQWLEKTGNAEVDAWTKAQDDVARAKLKKLPHVKQIQKQLTSWANATSPNYWDIVFAGGTFFALKVQPPKEQPILVSFTSPFDLKTEKIVFDPNVVSAGGKVSMDFASHSLDGKLVAISLSEGGSESGNLHVFGPDGKELGDKIERVNNPTAGGSVAWNKDGTGFYYTRYPHKGERADADMDFYQQVYFHKLGTDPKTDTYSIGEDFPRIAEVRLLTSDDGNHLLAIVANGDGGEFAHYLLPLNGKSTWRQLTTFKDKVISEARFGRHNDLYLLSRSSAPRGKILRMDLKDAQLKRARVVVPEGEGVINEFIPTENRLYVSEMVGGPSKLAVYDLDGKSLGQVHLADPVSDVGQLAAANGDEILYKTQSFLDPGFWSQIGAKDSKDLEPVRTALVVTSPVNFNDAEVLREFATSKDGTKVPLNIVAKKGLKRDGTNPTLLYAYGGYGINMTPRFRADLRLWLDAGGVYVLSNIRGGGEYGEEWHHQGMLAKKQNVFDDMIASAEYLISSKITSSQKLAIEGGSNGGLLMGAVLTQRPELLKAVVSHVGIYDSLRVELDPNGAFNVTEFGTVKDPEQFKALLAYSPLHNVKDGVSYPTVMLLTGVNDGRVNPYHSKKMAARLQAVSKNPVLLRVSYTGGHGIGSGRSERIAQSADVYAFLMSELKMKDPFAKKKK